MIQRHRLITRLGTDLKITATSVPDDEGDYVLYDDHLKKLESIGAGGVSGRVTQKTLDQHRQEFEAWALENGHHLTLYSDAKSQDDYLSQDTGAAWDAWLASKGINT